MLKGPTPVKPRQAAVLVLVEDAPNAKVVLTERRHDLASHPGQISFPGGRQEAEETLMTTALREAEEEISLQRSDVQVVGELTPLYVPPSNYLVHPFVAISSQALDLTPADGEVKSIIRAPLLHLLDPANRRVEVWKRRGDDVQIPLYDVFGHKVWGATAMILAEFIDLMRID